MNKILSTMKDQELLQKTKELFAREHAAIHRQLHYLGEIFRRRLYAAEGCESLFNYLVKHHGFSKAVAYQRVTIAKAGLHWPKILSMIDEKKFGLEGATLLAKDLLENKNETILDKAVGMSKEQIEILLLGESVPAKYKDSVRVIGVIEQKPTDATSPLGGLESEVPRNAQPLHSALNLVEPEAKNVVVKVSFSTNQEVMNKLQRVKDMLARKYPEGKLSDVLDLLVDSYLEKHAAEKATPSATPKIESSQPSTENRSQRSRFGAEPKPQNRSRYISVSLKRKIAKRDGHRCSFVGTNGQSCEATRFLEYDHAHPFALGGRSDDPENIRLLCSAHNKLRAVQTFMRRSDFLSQRTR